jgi:hypothetical protein
MMARRRPAPRAAARAAGPALLLVLLGIAAAGVVTVWLPSTLLARQVAAAVRLHLATGGTVRVTARATAWGLAAGRVDRIDVTATDVRLGELVARRVTARLRDVRAARDGRAWRIVQVASGQTEVEIGAEALQQVLASRGVQRAQVAIGPGAVAATGELRVGVVLLPLSVRVQPYSATGRDLRFRVVALAVGGAGVPSALADAVLAAAQPPVTFHGLPWPLRVTRVETSAGAIRIVADGGDVP